MSFYEIVTGMDLGALKQRIEACTAADVERALTRERLSESDMLAVLSPAAAPYLEEMAQRSAAITERRFGKIIQLYTPLYVSNECVNRCKYCGFAHNLEDVKRITLTPAEALADAQILYDEGFRHILIVSGESRHLVTMEYLEEIASELHKKFGSVSIEIFVLDTDEYRRLVASGVDGLTIFQETYDPELYKEYHPAGPKRFYKNRLDAMERGGEAGMRSLGLGTLLGLNDWHVEATLMAMHARYLMRRFWKSRVSINFPRIREAAGHYQPKFPVNDRDLVQMISAMRLILPDVELVLSTREPAALRDHLVGLGITRMSAGSKTNPGGYSDPDAGGAQFEVSDGRSPEAFVAMVKSKGFEPVWKDFDREFL
jgi:2-iminoacetate synthase